MARLVKTELKSPIFLDSCKKIQRVLEEKADVEVPLPICEEAWEAYSETLCAGWLMLPTHDDDIFWNVKLGLELLGYEIVE